MPSLNRYIENRCQNSTDFRFFKLNKIQWIFVTVTVSHKMQTHCVWCADALMKSAHVCFPNEIDVMWCDEKIRSRSCLLNRWPIHYISGTGEKSLSSCIVMMMLQSFCVLLGWVSRNRWRATKERGTHHGNMRKFLLVNWLNWDLIPSVRNGNMS